MKTEITRKIVNALNIIGTVATIIFLIWAFKVHLFTDEAVMKHYLGLFGRSAPIIFVIIQLVQVVVPIIPGAITIPIGILVFGHVYGFAFNFTGIMIGSVINFYLAKVYGRPFVRSLVSEKQYQKYIGRIENNHTFNRFFTASMFFPVTPADLLCYLAGLSDMSFKYFFISLSAGKPITLLAYSYGSLFVLHFFSKFMTGG
ncbi:MAG TPA: VTT domain-containing protein [Alloiococcus sp.]|nr:VTT domain-containing protein [Alloiococcus sp.]